MKFLNAPKLILLFCLTVFNSSESLAQESEDYVAYLFAYFTGNGPGEEAVRYALSEDGYTYRALNENKAVIDSKKISSSGGVRDPHILRGADGSFYMVITDLYVPEMGWQNYAMILLKSQDLIHWTHSIVNIPQTFPENFGDVNRVWAPQTIYDSKTGKYMLYWSMRHNQDRDIIYYAYANEDFTGLESEPKQLLYKKGACIDGDLVYKDDQYHLFFKNEDDGAKGIMKAVSDNIHEGYVVQGGYVDQTNSPVEGSGTFKRIDSDQYILMYDMYTSGKYQFCESSDLQNFKVIDQDISMNFHPRHGSVIPITQTELDALLREWGTLKDGGIVGAKSAAIKTNNILIDEGAGTVYLPILPATDASSFDPQLMTFPGARVSPEGPQDFTKGSVSYKVTLNDETKDYLVTVSQEGNPVLAGYYADPEILFSRKTGKYYLYPTSDGFHNWSGTHFEAFSSEDLSTWKPEGTILDLKTDVSWADRNAWAPTIEEKEIDNSYKYFYYYTAAQKIGVAVAEDPTGPFVDSGAPLIDFKPAGVKGGQEIDPDVFTDPVTGKSYLYWGNGYLAVAALNEDMVSIDSSSIKVLTPDATFREGAEVFYRNGLYYFMWSENDTRDQDYRVRYATATSPLGPLNVSDDNLVIAKDPAKGIYATGHNSVIKSQDTDDWYIVYHRFTRPKGIDMGRSAGFHREVCIDKLEFTAAGVIKPVKPTLEGVQLAKKTFEVTDPDFEKSPFTGVTKKHWKDAALYLLNGAFSYIDRLEDPMKFPKQPGKSYPHRVDRVPTEKLEGICRTLFLAAPLLREDPDLEISGLNVGEYYRHQIGQLINPESPSYIVPRPKNGGPSQNLVEYGALAISLMVAPDVLWHPLSQTAKDQLAASMLSYGDGPTVPSNWKFFNIFVLSFFKDQGYVVNEELLVEYLKKSLEDYRGQGWYNDNPAYDYYSMWAFQMYGMLWSEYFGKTYYPEIAGRFLENFKDLKGNYPYMFSKDGQMIMWGRSISYRMASVTPLSFMGFFEDKDINYGWMRRISSGVMLQFLQHPEFLEDNIPTLGFYGQFEPAVQVYSCRGSVFWMGKAFLSLLVPDESPFWTEVENNGAWVSEFSTDEVVNKFQDKSELLITDYPAIGAAEMRSWCHEKKKDDWQQFRSTENYNRLSYNSAFPWQADGVNGEVAMNYVFKNAEGEWEPFRLYTFKKFENGIYYRDAVLETNENIQMNLAEVPLPNGILRVDRNMSSDPIQMRLGHYALPVLEDGIKRESRVVKGHEIEIIDNGKYQLALVSLSGWESTETVYTTGLHPMSETSAVSNVEGKYTPDQSQKMYATLMLWKMSGEIWTDEELMVVKKMKYTADGVLVKFHKGEKTILFE